MQALNHIQENDTAIKMQDQLLIENMVIVTACPLH
jgi:hypothetical protein